MMGVRISWGMDTTLYNTAKNMSKHPEEFGRGSVEGVAAAESANNAVTGKITMMGVRISWGMDTTLAKRVVRNFPWRHMNTFTRIKPSMMAYMISSVYCIIFLVLIVAAVGTIVRGKIKERKAAAQKED